MQLVKRSNVEEDKRKLEKWEELAEKSKQLEQAAKALAEKVVSKTNGHHIVREK